VLSWAALGQQRSGNATDESAIRALEHKWDAANLKGDAAALDALFADGFIMTDSDGRVRTKAEAVDAVKNGKIKYQASATENLKIILHGDAAVVSGTWRGKFTHEGKAASMIERFTNFYVRQRGQWRCVASHGSAIK
jgi:uncharacterized protein (TIGR02246 family)